jgi:hypothetical protein
MAIAQVPHQAIVIYEVFSFKLILYNNPFIVFRQALAAADARIHAQNAAMVEQEARLTEANRLLALVSTRYAAARYHYI